VAAGELGDVGTIEHRDLQLRAGAHLRHDLRQIVLGNNEDHRNGLQLGNNRDSRRVGGLHEIAWIYKTQTNAAIDRRQDVTINEINFLGLDLGLIGFDGALELLDDVDLVLRLLARDGLSLSQILEARQIHSRLVKQTLIMNQLPLSLLLQRFKRTRIDLGQKVSLLDQLAFLEPDLREMAIDLRLNGHGRERCDRAEGVDDNANIARSNGRRPDRLGRDLRRPVGATDRRLGWTENLVGPHQQPDHGEKSQHAPKPRARLGWPRERTVTQNGLGSVFRRGCASYFVHAARCGSVARELPDTRPRAVSHQFEL
jgi:hypothetical protein